MSSILITINQIFKMKQLFFMLMVAITMFSCTENEIIVNIERVPCEFHTKSLITPEVDDEPMIRAISTDTLRTIMYEFNAPGQEVLTGTVKEDTPLNLDLVKGATYNAVFFYAPQIDGDLVTITDDQIFNVRKTFIVNTPIVETITLTRCIGQLTAKVGHIPANTTVTINLSAYNTFNWKYGSIILNDPSKITSVNKVNLVTDSTSSILGPIMNQGSRCVTAYVALYNQQGKLVKDGTYYYSLERNRNRIVTYNINNNNPNDETGDFIINIEDAWGENINDNQQIGKPQK